MRRPVIALAVAALLLATSNLGAQNSHASPGAPSSGRALSLSRLLTNPSVQNDLGLSRQQRSQLANYQHSAGQSGQKELPSTDILSQTQLERLLELFRQSQTASDGLAMLLFDPEIAQQLDLTEQQMEEIAFLELGFRLWSFHFLHQQGNTDEATQFVDDMRFWADLMIEDVLDDDQQALLEQLLGKPLQGNPQGAGQGNPAAKNGAPNFGTNQNRSMGGSFPGQQQTNPNRQPGGTQGRAGYGTGARP